MCRLFGLSATPNRVKAKFWLIEAPDSIATQSKRNPDGTGLGFFSVDGEPILDKQPLAAYEDPAFTREAKNVESTQFISHVRYATTGANSVENCHPFAMDGRIFAQNGMLGGLDRLDDYLGDELSLVRGQTDSERYFALITKEIRVRKGDVKAGLVAAVEWIVDNLPVCSLNCLLATPGELWALRYPETDRLFVLEREKGGRHGSRPLHLASSQLGVHSDHLADHPSVVVSSEPLDDSDDWRLLESGELIHVNPQLQVRSQLVLEAPPKYPLMPDYPASGLPTQKADARQTKSNQRGSRKEVQHGQH
jgi:predicted glutamine amidotransferase